METSLTILLPTVGSAIAMRIEHAPIKNSIVLLVGKHPYADCNPFGKLRFFWKNNHAILLSQRWKIRPEPYGNFKACSKGNADRRSFNPLTHCSTQDM